MKMYHVTMQDGYKEEQLGHNADDAGQRAIVKAYMRSRDWPNLPDDYVRACSIRSIELVEV